jgi:hypothetical protein
MPSKGGQLATAAAGIGTIPAMQPSRAAAAAEAEEAAAAAKAAAKALSPRRQAVGKSETSDA